jgi:flagellar hook protein FlgE
MMRSLFSGVQGLRAHQLRMDVIGNNVANVNTTAFKASRVNFAEMYSQTLTGAAVPTQTRGGINPKQIGLGVSVASIDTIMSEGSLQLTGKATDLAISGNGFFVLRDGPKYFYTRAGNFDFDAKGYLVNPATGQRVQGWMPLATGSFPSKELATLTDIQLPVADSVLASPTTIVTFDQSLNASAIVGDVHQSATTVIDSLGEEHTINLTFTKTAANTWGVAADFGGAPLTVGPPPSELQFQPDGSITGITTLNVTGFNPGNGANVMNFNLDFSRVIQPGLPGTGTVSTLRAYEYDGYPTGALTKISVDANGMITGFYSNGQYREVAQVALANFYNPGGLQKESNNNWIETPNSGLALVGTAGESGRGTVAPNSLEMSNVDISAEFTNMIVTQRGFQANSRVITTTDELLQDVVNLKR